MKPIYRGGIMGNIDQKMEKNLAARKKDVPATGTKHKFHMPGSRKKKGK